MTSLRKLKLPLKFKKATHKKTIFTNRKINLPEQKKTPLFEYKY